MVAESVNVIQIVNATGAIALAIVFLVLFWRGEIVSRPIMDKYIIALMEQMRTMMIQSIADISTRVIMATEAKLDEHDKQSKEFHLKLMERLESHDQHAAQIERNLKDEKRK